MTSKQPNSAGPRAVERPSVSPDAIQLAYDALELLHSRRENQERPGTGVCHNFKCAHLSLARDEVLLDGASDAFHYALYRVCRRRRVQQVCPIERSWGGYLKPGHWQGRRLQARLRLIRDLQAELLDMLSSEVER